jgi:hypothetical protein
MSPAFFMWLSDRVVNLTDCSGGVNRAATAATIEQPDDQEDQKERGN